MCPGIWGNLLDVALAALKLYKSTNLLLYVIYVLNISHWVKACIVLTGAESQ